MHTQRSLSDRCSAQLAKRRAARLARRAARAGVSVDELHKRSDLTMRQTSSNATEGACILTPEVTQGPYHVLGELVRQNITENEPGVPLTVEVDFVDIDTCEPVPVRNRGVTRALRMTE